MGITKAFAILAPVPEVHLISGMETCDREGKVVFGSEAWELFRQVDTLRRGEAVEVFIYPCHADSEKPMRLEACWHGFYVGHVPSRRGRYPGDKRFRPQSAETDKPTWAVFWEIEDLEELPEIDYIPIASLRGFDKKSDYALRTAPHGPLLIEYP